MSEPGISSEGFTKRTFKDIIAELKTKMIEIFGDGISTDASSPDVQAMGSAADHYVTMWDTLLQLFNQLDPATAEGSFLDLINAGVRGVPRITASPTKVTCELTGTPATVIPAGSLVSSSDPLYSYLSFATLQEVTLDGGGNGVVVVEANTNGPIEIPATTIDTIDTPVAGWDTVANSSEGVPGSNAEEDLEYRARGDTSTALRATSQFEALEAALLALDGVTNVKIYENMTSSVDANGIPAHSIEVFVLGGVDQEISQTVFDRAGFVGKYGTETGTAFDSRGRSYEVKWSRPTAVPFEVEVDVKEMSGWSISRVVDIKNACLDFYDGTLVQEGVEPGYFVDADVYAADLYAPVAVINTLRINSIGVRKKSVGPPYLSSVSLAYDEYPTLDTADIDVVHAP